jgi:hypothetical protein
MHIIYLMHMFVIIFLRVSVYLTPPSGRTYVLVNQNHLLFAKLLSMVHWLGHKI